MVRRESKRNNDEEKQRKDKSSEEGKKKTKRQKEMRDKRGKIAKGSIKGEQVCEIESEDANPGVIKAAVQPLPTHAYFCHFKSYPGQKKSEQTEATHEILIVMNVHVFCTRNN